MTDSSSAIETVVIFDMFLWSFLCNLIDMLLWWRSLGLLEEYIILQCLYYLRLWQSKRTLFVQLDSKALLLLPEKMRSGVPLTDEDRMPWLTRLRDLLVDQLVKGTCVVLACSALSPKYRDILRSAGSQFTSHRLTNGMYNNLTTTVQAGDSSCSPIVFVHLKATAQLLATRLKAREKTGTHFMPAVLLQSQIDSLEIESSETDILETDASLAPATIVLNIQAQLPI